MPVTDTPDPHRSASAIPASPLRYRSATSVEDKARLKIMTSRIVPSKSLLNATVSLAEIESSNVPVFEITTEPDSDCPFLNPVITGSVPV